MRKHSEAQTPVGVVPRRQVRSIELLMSDAPATCAVADNLEPSQDQATSAWARWLPSIAAFTAVAGALEWLKLTR